MQYKPKRVFVRYFKFLWLESRAIRRVMLQAIGVSIARICFGTEKHAHMAPKNTAPKVFRFGAISPQSMRQIEKEMAPIFVDFGVSFGTNPVPKTHAVIQGRSERRLPSDPKQSAPKRRFLLGGESFRFGAVGLCRRLCQNLLLAQSQRLCQKGMKSKVLRGRRWEYTYRI